MLAALLTSRPITERDTLYTFFCPEIARTARPGQFVEIRINNTYDPFLRRPISIFGTDGVETFSLLVRTVGRGTSAMSHWAVGTQLDVLGPLGNGFTWEEKQQTCVLVAGGIGLAPLSFLAQRLLSEGKRVRLLFSPLRDAKLLDALPFRTQIELFFCENRAAFPATLSTLIADKNTHIFACGPEGLLESTAEAAIASAVPCQLSVERRMACGIGICLGCAIAVHTEGGITYKKVCKDGPVFRGEEVAFHAVP